VIEEFDRPLQPEERDEVARRLDRETSAATTVVFRTGAATASVCVLLALWTLAASDAPRSIVIAFWSVLAVLLTLWIAAPQRRSRARQAAALSDALRANRARELRIQSSRVVEFEEIEDEGACYAFEADNARVLFVCGQEFYADDVFPNADFSLVTVLGSAGQPADSLIQHRGRKLEPERVVKSAIKRALQIPDHLETVAGPLVDIEYRLPRLDNP